MTRKNVRRPASILADVRRLAVEYYETTGRPLGVTGELAEEAAHRLLGLELAEVRSPGFDAVRRKGKRVQKVQIKGRRIAPAKPRYHGRVGKIDLGQSFHTVVLVLFDPRYEPVEVWEASRAAVTARLTKPGSKARNERGSLSISQFVSIATKVWP